MRSRRTIYIPPLNFDLRFKCRVDSRPESAGPSPFGFKLSQETFPHRSDRLIPLAGDGDRKWVNMVCVNAVYHYLVKCYRAIVKSSSNTDGS